MPVKSNMLGSNKLSYSLYCVALFLTISTAKYQPSWESLDNRPLPDWYDEAKLGIFIHWGVFSVPSLTSEWFWFDWFYPDHNPKLHSEIVNYMNTAYKPGFTYQDFAKDFTAEFFNATEWTDIIEKSGAKYVVLTTKHHDGFALWPSKYSYSWNSADIGPHRDIVGELANAIRKSTQKIHFGLYHSLYEWYNPVYVADRSSNFSTQFFVDNKLYPEMVELVETYRPEVFWSDGEAEAPSSYWKSEEFLAWLYNESPVSDVVVVNDRWGTETACKHGGFYSCADRYTPGSLQLHKWENAMTIDRNTWGYSRLSNVEDYLTTQELIDSVVQTVAFGGNILMNVGPSKDGKIAPIFQERLLDLGKWLKINGEAIYGTEPWKHCQNDTTTQTVWYTTKKNSSDIYAIMLRWPKDGLLHLSCPSLDMDKVYLLELRNIRITWTISEGIITLQLPQKSLVDINWGWAIKIRNGFK